jgi:hypothetical protein
MDAECASTAVKTMLLMPDSQLGRPRESGMFISLRAWSAAYRVARWCVRASFDLLLSRRNLSASYNASSYLGIAVISQ